MHRVSVIQGNAQNPTDMASSDGCQQKEQFIQTLGVCLHNLRVKCHSVGVRALTVGCDA